MAVMKICVACERHIMGGEPQCPFCGAALPTTGSWRSYATTLGLSLGLMTAACGTATSSSDGGSSGADTGSATGATSSTVPPTASSGPVSASTSGGTMSSTGSETGLDDAQTDDPDDQGGSFYAGVPDMSAPECDLFEQDCPDGEKCMPWASAGGTWDAARCSQVAESPQQVGQVCSVEGSAVSGIDDCDIGLMCFDVDDKTNIGTCIALCEGSLGKPVCEDQDAVCSIFNDGVVPVCSPDCHPLAQDCDEGSVCIPVNDGLNFACVSTMEAVAAGEPCDNINSCAAGLACLEAAADCGPGWGCCHSYCDTSVGDPDSTCAAIAPGQACEAWYQDPVPPGFDDVGICL